MSHRPTGHHLVAVAMAGLLLAGCTGQGAGDVAGGDAGPASADLAGAVPVTVEHTLPDRTGLQDVLDELAHAFVAGDREAVAARLLDPASAFGQRWQDRATWMTGLPLAHYALDLDEAFADMASDELKQQLPGAQVVYVVEELAVEGFDPPDAPAREDLFLTVVPDGDGGWLVVGDEDAERLGFVSVDHLWDLGPVTTTRREDVGAIHHPDVGVAQLLDEAERALATAQARWPRDFPPLVPILVPRTEEELGELLHVSFDLSNFVAFATATSSSEGTGFELTGSRIVVNPDRFLRRSTATRELILVHEFVHVATHRVAGLTVPNWIDEGVAQAVGEQRSSTGTSLLQEHVAAGNGGDLPTDHQFRIGGRNRVFLSYQQAWSFVDHLAATYGVGAVADFYAAAGAGGVGLPGSEDWLVDRAAREVFGVSLDQLRADWAAAGAP